MYAFEAGRRTVVLIGRTGAGKSVVANALSRGDFKGAFPVSDSLHSVTKEIKVVKSDVPELDGWNIVDTPGLGDFELPRASEDHDAFMQRSIAATVKVIESITKTLHRDGGLILLVQKAERLQLAVLNQLRALLLLLDSSVTNVVLLLTHIPREIVRSVPTYDAWLKERKSELEQHLEVHFAAVHGLSTGQELDGTHPASVKQLIRFVADSYAIWAVEAKVIRPWTSGECSKLRNQDIEHHFSWDDGWTLMNLLNKASYCMGRLVRPLGAFLQVLDSHLDSSRLANLENVELLLSAEHQMEGIPFPLTGPKMN